jgi:hypothetical protein
LSQPASERRDHLKRTDHPSRVLFGYSTDPETGEPVYGYKPSLAGAPWQFRLVPGALAWRLGVRSGRVPYGDIRRVRLSFRPAGLLGRRFIAEIWPAAGPKLIIASSSWKGIAEQERLDTGYVTFVAELHRRLAASASTAACERGAPAWLYWPALVVGATAAFAMVALIFEALQTGVLGGALFVAAFLALFLWQSGDFFRRNRPGTYRPDAPPAAVLPAAGSRR